MDVWELFTDTSCLGAILDRQGLMVAAQADLRTKKAESFAQQALQGFWSKMKIKNSKVVVMSMTVSAKNTKQKEIIWQKYRGRLALTEYQILSEAFPFNGNRIRKALVLKESTIPSEEIPLPMGAPARHATQVDFP